MLCLTEISRASNQVVPWDACHMSREMYVIFAFGLLTQRGKVAQILKRPYDLFHIIAKSVKLS